VSDEPRGQGEVESRFAQRIRAFRRALDWSAQKLADRLAEQGHPELTRAAISKIETMGRRISLDEAVAFCEAFGVGIAEMVGAEPYRFEINVEVTL